MSCDGCFLKYDQLKQPIRDEEKSKNTVCTRAAANRVASEKSAVGENHSSAESLPSSTQKGGAADNRKGAGGGGRRQSVQLDQLTREQIARQILNEVFPPKLIRTPDGQQFIQEVSGSEYNEEDIEMMEWKIEEKLQQPQEGVRLRGVCDTRYNIYEQVFDELVRQEICVQPERGRLLARVRDECQFAVDTYKKLFPSGATYSARKTIICERVKETTKAKMKQLQDEKEEMLRELSDLKMVTEGQERKQAEVNAHEERERIEEVAFWKRTNQLLESNVKDIKGQWMDMVRLRQSEEYKKSIEDRRQRMEVLKMKMREKQQADARESTEQATLDGADSSSQTGHN